MKKKSRNILISFIAITTTLMLTFAAYAGDMTAFSYQNPNHFSAPLTRGLQAMLNDFPASHADIGGTSGIDGDYGNHTAMAVAKFQGKKGLTVDGSCGPMTWTMLRNSLSLYAIGGTYTNYYMKQASGLGKGYIVKQHNNNADWYCYTGVAWRYIG